MLFEHAVPDLPKAVSRTPAALQATLADRVSASKTRARRRWAARSILMLTITGVLLIFLVIWRRDTYFMEEAMRSARESADAANAHLARTGLLPAALPSHSPAMEYASYADRFYAQQVSRPVIIASSPLLVLKLRSSGRCVIIHESGKVHQPDKPTRLRVFALPP
jgi:hypothetical protein